MTRQILLIMALGFSGTAPVSAGESPAKGFYLNLAAPACGAFAFFKLSKKQPLLPSNLVGGKIIGSYCGNNDTPVAGTIAESELALYDLFADSPDYFWMWTFQWPLQDGGSWTEYLCYYQQGCNVSGSGTYALGLPQK